MRISVDLQPEEGQALLVLARRARRHPRQQAALLLRHALERRGLLKRERPAPKQPEEAVRHA